MAMYEYECKKCGTVQTKWHSMNDNNQEPCEKEDCKAPPDELQRLLSRPAHYKHISWSKWRV